MKDFNEKFVPIGKHVLPPLPYDYDALEPIISKDTLHFHHDKHHLGYVNGLNAAELALEEARKAGDLALVKHWEREVAFNGSGHLLHSIYWTVMTPNGQERPDLETEKLIEASFGSFTAFKEQFVKAAVAVEASGWAILAWNTSWQRLEVLNAEKHQNLAIWGSIPILVIDLWEHAYYLDYQNRRADYVNAWWPLINWEEVDRRLALAKGAQTPIELS